MPEIKEIEYVLAVADCRSISKAAEQLYISQPSLSRYLSRLEAEAGVALFERKTDGIRLTEAGELYVEYGRKIWQMNQQLEQGLKSISQNRKNHIRVCMSLNAGFLLSGEIQEKLRERYPEVTLELINVMSKDMRERLCSGKADFAVGPDIRGGDPSLIYEYLAEEYLLLAAPQNRRLSDWVIRQEGLPYPWLDLSKLPELDLILQEDTCNISQNIHRILNETGCHSVSKLVVANSMLAIQAAERGMGCCFLSEAFLPYLSNREELQLFCVGKPVQKTVSGVMYTKDKRLTPQEKYCIRLLKEALQIKR